MGSKPLQQAAKITTAGGRLLERSIPGGKMLIPTAISMFNPAIGAAYKGATTYARTGNLGQSVKNAAISYVAPKIGSYAGNALGAGTVGSAFGDAANTENTLASGLGNVLGRDTANAVAGNIATTGLGEIAGNYAGNSMMSTPRGGPAGPAPFKASQQGQAALPGSLSAFGSLSPEQQSSNIATQGVYGGGAGPQESSYFTNLINRRLVDKSGHMDSDLSEINPIESSYLSQLGLGGYKDSKSLLEAISKWKPA